MAENGEEKTGGKPTEEDWPLVRTVLWALTAAFVMYFFVVGFNFLEDVKITNHTYSVEQADTPIFSLHDGTGVTGTFFLGSGSVEGEGYYVYYYAGTGPMKYKRATVPSDYAEIAMDEEDAPYLREFTMMETYCTRKGCSTDPVGYTTRNDGWYHGYKKWELHVPNGTLTRDMEVGHA
jgi:hypothetical protein